MHAALPKSTAFLIFMGCLHLACIIASLSAESRILQVHHMDKDYYAGGSSVSLLSQSLTSWMDGQAGEQVAVMPKTLSQLNPSLQRS